MLIEHTIGPCHSSGEGQITKRKIRLIKAPGMVGIELSKMLEKQLVKKANLALGWMEAEEENKQDAIKFVGVSIERGLGGVVYEMNSSQSAGWLK